MGLSMKNRATPAVLIPFRWGFVYDFLTKTIQLWSHRLGPGHVPELAGDVRQRTEGRDAGPFLASSEWSAPCAGLLNGYEMDTKWI